MKYRCYYMQRQENKANVIIPKSYNFLKSLYLWANIQNVQCKMSKFLRNCGMKKSRYMN